MPTRSMTTASRPVKAKGDKAPMAFFIGREIYSHLEKITDRFEDVANEIQGLVLDHA